MRWRKSIYASIKRAKRYSKSDTDPIWTSLNLDKSPHFFLQRYHALKNSWDEAQKKKTENIIVILNLHQHLAFKYDQQNNPKIDYPKLNNCQYTDNIPSVQQCYYRNHESLEEWLGCILWPVKNNVNEMMQLVLKDTMAIVLRITV